MQRAAFEISVRWGAVLCADSPAVSCRHNVGVAFTLALAQAGQGHTRLHGAGPCPSAGTGGGAAGVAGTRASGIGAGNETTGAALTPELLAHLIRLIEQGLDLPTIVQELRLPTSLALEAKRQYDLLVAASGRSPLRQLMSELVAHCVSRGWPSSNSASGRSKASAKA